MLRRAGQGDRARPRRPPPSSRSGPAAVRALRSRTAARWSARSRCPCPGRSCRGVWLPDPIGLAADAPSPHLTDASGTLLRPLEAEFGELCRDLAAVFGELALALVVDHRRRLYYGLDRRGLAFGEPEAVLDGTDAARRRRTGGSHHPCDGIGGARQLEADRLGGSLHAAVVVALHELAADLSVAVAQPVGEVLVAGVEPEAGEVLIAEPGRRGASGRLLAGEKQRNKQQNARHGRPFGGRVTITKMKVVALLLLLVSAAAAAPDKPAQPQEKPKQHKPKQKPKLRGKPPAPADPGAKEKTAMA